MSQIKKYHNLLLAEASDVAGQTWLDGKEPSELTAMERWAIAVVSGAKLQLIIHENKMLLETIEHVAIFRGAESWIVASSTEGQHPQHTIKKQPEIPVTGNKN